MHYPRTRAYYGCGHLVVVTTGPKGQVIFRDYTVQHPYTVACTASTSKPNDIKELLPPK